jgi:hypothetical protein
MATEIEPGELRGHCALVAKKLLRGAVVPFLGAGVNLCERSANSPWRLGERLPSGAELAGFLAKEFDYPFAKACSNCGEGIQMELDLARVSQFGVAVEEEGPLYEQLERALSGKFAPTSVHQFLAQLPVVETDELHIGDRYPLIVTTNYDDLMEQALGAGNYDLVYYDTGDRKRLAKFWHVAPGEPVRPIDRPNEDPYPFCQQRPVVLKIHGTMTQGGQEHEVVITEDDYIEYLAERSLETLLPSSLLGKMRTHHLWFLGYSLRDWNFRVFQRSLQRNVKRKFQAWAVLLSSDAAEKNFWLKNGIDISNARLGEYIALVKQQLTELKTQSAQA